MIENLGLDICTEVIGLDILIAFYNICLCARRFGHLHDIVIDIDILYLIFNMDCAQRFDLIIFGIS